MFDKRHEFYCFTGRTTGISVEVECNRSYDQANILLLYIVKT